jgi:hypothetical protein
MINTYEPDTEGVEQLVYRPMNDEEYAQFQLDREAAKNAPDPEHPVLSAVRSMSDEDKAALRSALGVS